MLTRDLKTQLLDGSVISMKDEQFIHCMLDNFDRIPRRLAALES